MASNIYAYVKSLIWLSTLGGLGYGLMRLTEPSQETLNKIRNSTGPVHATEENKKKLLFMQKLKEAAGDKSPIYLKKKDDK